MKRWGYVVGFGGFRGDSFFELLLWVGGRWRYFKWGRESVVIFDGWVVIDGRFFGVLSRVFFVFYDVFVLF